VCADIPPHLIYARIGTKGVGTCSGTDTGAYLQLEVKVAPHEVKLVLWGVDTLSPVVGHYGATVPAIEPPRTKAHTMPVSAWGGGVTTGHRRELDWV
jgi:hypothetical protein